MAKKAHPIPVNTMVDEAGAGIAIEKITIPDSYIEDLTTANGFEAAIQPHQHDRHSSVIYIHPNQVHRTCTFANVVVSSLAIDNDNLRSFIEEVQASAERNIGENFIPRTEETIHKRNTDVISL